jgi:nitrogen fixation/metabolism regulation signal transduction histidine kinase
LAVVVVAASTSAMFLAPADLRLVLTALLLGAGLGVILAISVTGPLIADLRQLAAAAARVADGDLTVRTQVIRNDEVGHLAVSLDLMVAQLAALDQHRAAGEAARRRLLTSIGHDLRTPLGHPAGGHRGDRGRSRAGSAALPAVNAQRRGAA